MHANRDWQLGDMFLSGLDQQSSHWAGGFPVHDVGFPWLC